MRTSGASWATIQRVFAGVAQLAEQSSCKRQASGSNPLTGSQLRGTSRAHVRAADASVQPRVQPRPRSNPSPVTRRSPSQRRRSPRVRPKGARACMCSSSARSGCGQGSSSQFVAKLLPPASRRRAARAAGRRRRPASALGRPGRRAPAPGVRTPQIGQPHPARSRVTHKAVFLGVPLSRSRPPRLGRSLRSRRMRSASPNLDPAATHQDSAPIEEDRRRAGHGMGLAELGDLG